MKGYVVLLIKGIGNIRTNTKNESSPLGAIYQTVGALAQFLCS